MKFILNGCDISFVAEAPEDITLKQLIKQCDKIKPDWCACGICSLDYVGYSEDEEAEIKIGYDTIEKVGDVSCRIEEQSKGEPMKLSEELKHCIDGDSCEYCRHWKRQTKLTCRGLLQAAYEQVKRNEELKEQGRLIELPCKVGETVYVIRESWSGYVIDKKKFKVGMAEKVGKTVFLTQEEAEAALQALKETEGESEKEEKIP